MYIIHIKCNSLKSETLQGQIKLLLRIHESFNKKLSTKIKKLFELFVQGGSRVSQSHIAFSIPLSCHQNWMIRGYSRRQKTPQFQDREKTKQKSQTKPNNNKPISNWDGSFLLSGQLPQYQKVLCRLQRERRQKGSYPAVNSMNYKPNLPGKMCLVLQQWHDCYGSVLVGFLLL